jgi:uncharacterized protein (TIGR01244 family)|tara:strand:- start:12550 stop:12978 length:429 start_codon:yes stop_codon:yes gene_type:complete
MDIRKLDGAASAAPQITPADIAEIKAAGFRGLINNRPDHEDKGQPTNAEIAAAAADAGLSYAHVPLGREPMTEALVKDMREALNRVGEPALMFCRSGTRSTTLWALAEAGEGRDVDEIIKLAADAGYDLAPMRNTLETLAKR